MTLTNEELEHRMRSQTDMIQYAQTLAVQALQKVNSLETQLSTAQSEAASALALSHAALKSEDTTQKLLKELIREIKDLRDDGNVQQKQIDQIRKEFDEFKEEINAKISRCNQDIQENKTPNVHIHGGGWYGSTYGVTTTCNYANNVSVTTTCDENGNATGHTAFMNIDTITFDDAEKRME